MKPFILAVVVAALYLGTSPGGAFLPDAAAGDKTAHPHFDDQGTLDWKTTLADAQKEAKRQGKLIFIEYGRAA